MGKSKTKATKEDDDDEKKGQKAVSDKFAATLAAEHACGVKEHKTGWCWIRNDGQHIPLERNDLSTWALWIVSHHNISAVSLLTKLCVARAGGRPLYVRCQRQ